MAALISVFDISSTVRALLDGSPTPAQQREAACMLILLSRGLSWQAATALNTALMIALRQDADGVLEPVESDNETEIQL